MMINYPVFKPHLKVYAIPHEGAVLIGTKSVVLQGDLYAEIVPLLNGKNSMDDIALSLENNFPTAEVFYAINLLVQAGHIVECPQYHTPLFTPLWSPLGLAPDTAKERLENKSICILGVDSLNVQAFITQLQSYFIQSDQAADLRLFITDNYFNDALTQQAKIAFENKKAFLIVNPYGTTPALGPLFLPDTTGCFYCFQKRVRYCGMVESFAIDKQTQHSKRPSPFIADPLLNAMIMQMCVIEMIRYLLQPSESHLHNQLLALSTSPWQIESHTFVPFPGCPYCGPKEQSATVPAIQLKAQPVNLNRDGGYRSFSPERTLETYRHLISPICGIVSELTHGHTDSQIPVYVSGFNRAISIRHLSDLKINFRSFAAGKGLEEKEAKVGALCESLERYSSLYHGTEITRKARYEDIKHEAIHPQALMLFSELQYEQRAQWNNKGSTFNRVPVRFDESLSIDWSPIWSLSNRCVRWVPTAYLYFEFQKSKDFYCIACSNGNAAGNNLEEAILQGFFEVVERDSVCIWWYNRIQRPAVDLSSFQNTRLMELRDYYQQNNRDIWVLDITSDLEIPTFVAISNIKNTRQEHILFGFGCHFDAEIAICRAVTEMNQMLALDNDLDKLEDEETLAWLNTATLKEHFYLQAHPTLPIRTAQDYPEQKVLDLKGQIEQAQGIIESKGMEMLIADLTRSDVGLPVAKVIIPEMRHFWARYAPGRLYDVPVQMGWLAKPLTESALNPVPIFL
jgi:bacteriocin biosynthesis cyclodehydratase domain-containing protein